jgi:non-specific serine/threonine protein kinase
MPKTILTVNLLNIPHLVQRTDRGTLQQGQWYYQQRRVSLRSVDEDGAHAVVRGTRPTPYDVYARVANDRVYFLCDCPLADGDPKITCKHIIAFALVLRDYLHTNPPMTWETVVSRAVEAAPPKAAPTAKSLLLFSLQQRYSSWGVFAYSLPANGIADPTADARVLLKNIKRERLANQAKPVRSKTDSRHYVNITEDNQGALQLLGMIYEAGYNYYGSSATSAKNFLPLLRGSSIFRGSENSPFQHVVEVATAPAIPTLQVTETAQGLRLQAMLRTEEFSLALDNPDLVQLNLDPLWLLHENIALPVEGGGPAFEPFYRRPELVIPDDARGTFVERYLLPLAARVPMIGSAIARESVSADPQPRLYLSEQDGELLAALRFGYGEHEAPYEKGAGESLMLGAGEKLTLVSLTRQADKEQDAWQSVSDFGLKRGPEAGTFVLRANVAPVDFLLRQVPRLASAGFEVYGEEALTSARVNRHAPQLSWRVSSGIDWFDLDAVITYGDQELALKDIRRAVRRHERYIKLADGTIGEIPDEWLERYRTLFAFADETEGGLRLDNSQIGLLDQLMDDGELVDADPEFEKRRERLRAFEKVAPQRLAKGLNATLRPYQKAGVDWLHFLHDYEFGGCLADDMGLGKTVTALAFLQSLHERKASQSATLLVLPRSLVSNWERESERFTPGLRVLNHSHPTRAKDIAEFDGYDLVLTTYGILLRDIELLRQHRFHYVILDEAQAIKNPLSQSGRAARLLQADHRLTLTGTPVENSTLELWSQFAFLNPGLLGTLEQFRSEFVTPIEKNQDETAAKSLRGLVRPFLLRRTKDQVARDLPPRTERIVTTEMEPAQRKLYDAKRDEFRAQILGLMDEQGMNNVRMKILEGLLRLRQISNHPRLVDPGSKAGSAKMDTLLETLETLRSEGHKALVFSQFVGMLTLLRTEMDARQIPYAYLDGKTKDRQERVDTFQNDPALPFFLISLRAGGVGLNLTAADYVLHIDPWWNPAVEMQATDRTHRIGQDKPVFVYKFIARDSVEEKILELQERKRSLVTRLVGTEAGLFKSLTRKDIEGLFR